MNPEETAVPEDPTVANVMSTKLPIPQQTRKKRRRWPKVVAAIFLGILVFSGVYGSLLYKKVRDNVIIAGGGDSHNLLAYSNATTSEDTYATGLKQPGDGRVNILLLGIGGINDAGQAHNGTDLTDSIQLISLDTVNKKVSTTSIPRDFLVNIPGYGPNKINAVYEYGNMAKANGGGQAIRTMIGTILGVNISNFIIVDFTAAKEAVDTVGGVDINAPTAIYDPSYPCDDQINYCPFSISAGQHHLDGAVALEYMRTRHDDSDFARAGRQQMVLAALKAKALSLGTLSSPAKITSLIGILGSHIKTDLTSSQLVQLASFYESVPSGSTTNNVLSTDAKLSLITAATNQYAGDVEEPIGGLTAYGPLQTWFAKNNPDPFTVKEVATVTVIGGYGATTKQVAAFVQKLNDYGFTAIVGTTPSDDTVTKTELFSTGTDKPVSSNYLSYLTGTTEVAGTPLHSGSNFEIIYAPGTTKN